MQRFTLSLLVTTTLVTAGCSFSFSSTTNNKSKSPDGSADGGEGQGQTDGDGDGGGANAGDGKSRARDSASTSGVGRKKAGKRIKPSEPPRDDDDDNGEPADDVGELTTSGFAPTSAVAGTLVEVYGDGLGSDPAKLEVKVSGVVWPVEQVLGDRVVVKVPDDAKSGEVSVKRGRKPSKVPGAFTLLQDDGGLVRPADTLNGLLGEVFDLGGEATGLPDFSTFGRPSTTIAVANLDIPVSKFEQGFPAVGKDLKEWFAIRFTGSLNVTEGGEYEFCLNSDDGSRLFLEDTLVVDNDGIHTATQKCELVYLEPGEYGIRVEYFQGAGSELALQLSWGKDGGAVAPIPSNALFRPESMVATSGNNNGQ